LDIVRGFATRAGRVDVGARARQLQAQRLWTIALSGTAVAGFVIVILNTFQENLMFYITPTQALEKFFLDPKKNRFRLGGLVLEGSVQHFKNSTEMEFVVTDLANEILVRYRGALPDLFREGHSVVAEGFVRPFDQYPGDLTSNADQHASLTAKAKESGCYFAAIEVLAKHDEKYMPKEVAAAVAKNKAMQENQEMPALLTTSTPVVAAAMMPSPPPSQPMKKGVAQAPAVAQSYEINV
jgi:cytochrome c-type biogenesis protein CcmE